MTESSRHSPPPAAGEMSRDEERVVARRQNFLQLRSSLIATRNGVNQLFTRRGFMLAAGAAGAMSAAGLLIKHRAALSRYESYQPLLDAGDSVGRHLQRSLMWGQTLAREYRPEQLSIHHPSNGGFGSTYVDPNPQFDRMVITKFRDWRLRVAGLVSRPSSFRLDELRAMPTRTQITMHSCDEGWSAIGQWTGVPLGWILQTVGIKPNARYIVFHAMDSIGGVKLFDSIDLFDAFHPQTILAHGFNGISLPVKYGAPLRLRLELQIGYKNVKHLERIEAVDSLAHVGKVRGGFYQQQGYQWYAGQ